MLTKITSFLPEMVEKKGIAPQVRLAAALEAFVREASAKLSEAERGDFRPLHLRSGTLTIACKSTSVALLLKHREAELLQAMSETGGEPVQRLRTILAPWR